MNLEIIIKTPSLSQDQITWQYSVVKPDYAFPEIEYEILSELFIPENSEHYYEEEENTGDNNRLSQHFVLDKLETVSLYLTGNLPEDEKQKIDSQSSQDRRVCILFICWDEPDPWYPSGQILIDDSELGKRGVEGVLVKARRWFTTKSTRTNAGGHFRIGSFKRDVNYSLDWETYQFSIREEGWWFFSKQAGINGPKKREAWKVHLTQNSKSWFHATIFQAAYHYYYYDIKGLKRPPQNSFWKPQMKIIAFYKNNDDKNGSYAKDLRLFGIFAPIRMYNPERSSSQIYATTIHELAHGSHWELRQNDWNFDQTSEKVKESWARGVEWELTRMKYPLPYRGRTWNLANRDYTLVVIDMMDGRETAATRTNLGFVDERDEVSGYTIKQIENTLSNTSSWKGWCNNIKNRYSNPTKNNLDKLFRAYE